jgi:prepilin-type N-terminal cleavage/methylation domain-containing protein
MNTDSQSKGFSLLELLLVVAVGAILILAGLAIYRNVTQNVEINEATRLLNVIKQETQRLYQGEGSYGANGDSLEAILVNANIVPSGNLIAGAVRTPFSTDADVNANTDGRFDITFNDVPSNVCINLALAYTEDDPDFDTISINGTSIDPTALGVAEANARCTAATEVDMVWTFF